MHPERFRIATLVTAAALLYAQPSQAYCRSTSEPPLPGQSSCQTSGKPLYWRSECIGFRIGKALPEGITPRDAERRLRAAFDRWITNNPVCSPSIDVVVLGASESTATTYSKAGPNENLVLFGDGNLRRDRGYTDEPSLATVTFVEATGEMLDGDLEVDLSSLTDWSEEPSAPDAGPIEAGIGPDLDVTLTHAAGHLLGLTHSEDESSLLHAAFHTLRRGDPEPSADDAAGVCAIYGEDGTRSIVGEDEKPALLPAAPCDFGGSVRAGSSCGPADVGHGCSIRPGQRAETGGSTSLLAVAIAAAGFRARRWRHEGRSRDRDLNPHPHPPHVA